MVALVTGASGGIGRAVATVFAEHGYNVAVNYSKSEQAARDTVAAAEEAGGIAKAYRADVTDSAEVLSMVKSVVNDFGAVDVLVNNAGVSLGGLLQDITDEQYDFIMDTNVKGVFNTCRAVLPFMISKKCGSIVNVSSIWGEVGASCETLYSASKAAVIGLTKALAKEVGPSGIRVNCVSPGIINTKMNACYSAETLETLREETPLCTLGNPEDIAKSIYFLCSDEADFITGQDLGVNGGFVI